MKPSDPQEVDIIIKRNQFEIKVRPGTFKIVLIKAAVSGYSYSASIKRSIDM
jgi:hypothetical protein